MDDENAAFRRSPKTVLVVEDSPVQLLILVELLERKGLMVICATDGRMGLQMAQKRHPDLIILDIEMPEMDGLEVCRALKQDEMLASIPIILFTSHVQPEVFVSGMQAGAIDFIPKDAFSEAVLVQTLVQLNFLTDQNELQAQKSHLKK